MTPKIILIDLESSPIFGLSWESYQTNLLKILQPSKIISVAWKQLGEETTHCLALSDFKNYKPNIIDDEKLVKAVWEILDTADVVIGHNSEAFDNKKLNARFVAHGLSAPSGYQSVDTLKAAKKWFRFDKNNLDYLGEYLNVGHKLETGGFKLWTDCIAGKLEAWERLKVYNRGDVDLLEKVYLRLRPYITTHPNLSLLSDKSTGVITCGSCMSVNLQKRGFSYTLVGRKQRYQCKDCSSWTTGAWQRNSQITDQEEEVS